MRWIHYFSMLAVCFGVCFATGSQQSAFGKEWQPTVVAGEDASCAIVTGGIKCWGKRENGKIGDGRAMPPIAKPVDVSGLGPNSGVTGIALRGSHVCAIVKGGLKCWGNNWAGQLGDGTQTKRLKPVDVQTLGEHSGVTDVATSSSHTCVVVNGGVKCFGANYQGELGNATKEHAAVPVDVKGLGPKSDVTMVAAGGGHTCAVIKDTSIKCWGFNMRGQLGNGNLNASLTPVDVVGLKGKKVLSIATGRAFSCAATDAGIFCWGNNEFGALGTSGFEDSKTPVGVTGLTAADVSQLSASNEYACVVHDGKVKCWGQLAFVTPGPEDYGVAERRKPLDISGIGKEKVSHVATGSSHLCVATKESVKCFGYNRSGELGDGKKSKTKTPILVEVKL